LVEIAWVNAVVRVVQVEVARVVVNVNMSLGRKVVCVVPVYPAADVCLDVSWAVVEVVLEMKMSGAPEAGESDGGGD
jgi:hypothetical protein